MGFLPFLQVLFDPEDSVCAANTLKDTKSQLRGSITEPAQWVCVNPLQNGSTRAIKNIKTFRSFIVEIDKGVDLEDQIDYINSLGFPYSSIVFSGNKSYHFVLSLATPVDREVYTNICKAIKDRIEYCDPSVLSASALTRMAGGIRDGTKIQNLVFCGKRISRYELDMWLKQTKPWRPVKKDDNFLKAKSFAQYELTPWVTMLLEKGINANGMSRHEKMKRVAIALRKAGLDRDESFAKLYNAVIPHNPDMDKYEVEKIIEWVWENVAA